MIRLVPILLAALFMAAPSARSADIFGDRQEFIPRELDTMYVKGLLFLVKHQTKEGTFKAPGSRSAHYGSQPGLVGLAVEVVAQEVMVPRRLDTEC